MEHVTGRYPDAKDRKLAEQVILEIARQSPGDEIIGKTRVFKAFYLAHLFYADEFPGYLTEWPIVRMPHGPGVEGFDELIAALVRSGILEAETTRVGPYPSTKYRATKKGLQQRELSDNAVKAVRQAVEFIEGKTGAQLSDITHEFSISWNEAKDGVELNIYKDLLDDEEHAKMKGAVADLDTELEEAWGQ